MSRQRPSIWILGPPGHARVAVERALIGRPLQVQVRTDFSLRLEPLAATPAAVLFDASQESEAALAACRAMGALPELAKAPRLVLVPPQLRSTAFSSGATDVLITPVVAAEVRERVRCHTERAALERTVFGAVNEAMLVLREGRIVDCNGAAQRLFGCSRTQLLGLTPVDVAPPIQNDGRPTAEHVRRRIAGAIAGDGVTFESDHRRHDGTLFPAAITLAVVPDEPGLLIATLRDLTEARATARAQAEADAVHRAVHGATADAVFVGDEAGRLTFVCANVEALLGITVAQAKAIGTIHGILGPPPPGALELVPLGESRRLDWPHPAGARVLEVLIQGVQIGAGRQLYVCRDVTAAREGARAFRSTSAQLTALLEVFPESAYVVDPESYEVLLASRALCEMLGDSPVGERCYRAIYGLDAPCDFCNIEALRADPGRTHRWEHENLHLGRHLLHSDRLIDWPDGRTVRFEVAVDVTERKRLEQRLADAQATAGLGTWELDLATGRLWWSDEVFKIVGRSPASGEVTYDGFLASVHPEDRQRVDELYQRAVRSQEPFELEHRVRLADGRVRSIYERGRTILGPGGTPQRTIGTVLDVTSRVESARRLHQALVATVEAIGRAMDKRDPYTSNHQSRVAQLAVAIGRRLHLNDHRLEGLRLGASIHDIGKIYVPVDLLNRPRRLTPVEFALVKEHSAVGEDIIAGIEFPWPVLEMIGQHHERLDGSGYPAGLEGDAIVLEARIIAVADVVEAMASHRPYRPSLGLSAALSEIRKHRGRLYEPDAVDACLAAFDEGFVWQETGPG